MRLFRRRITEDTDLERLSDRRLLEERERLVREASDPHGGSAAGATFGLASDIEDVLDAGASATQASRRSSRPGGATAGRKASNG